MYVVRLDSNNNMATSKPCAMCIDYMKFYGIKVVRFINSFNQPEEIKLT